MKNLLIMISLLGFLNTGFSAEVYGPTTSEMDVYTVRLHADEMAKVEVGVTTSYGCWNQYYYTKLQTGDKIVILRTPVYHTMQVCDMPVARNEGIKFNIITSFDIPAIYKIYVPKGVTLKVK